MDDTDSVSFDLLRGMYATMVKIRLFEERAADLVEAGEIKCPCHLHIGQEAIATGVCAALDREDSVWGGHRSHGHYLAKGDIIMRMDAHSRYDSKYITKCVRALDEYSADSVGGILRIIPRTDSLVGKAIVKSLSHRFGVGNAQYRLGDLKGPTWVKTGSFYHQS